VRVAFSTYPLDGMKSPDPPATTGRVVPFEPIDRVDRFVMPFVRETTLWPVLAVVIGHAGVLIALAILEAVRDRNPIGWLALTALALLSLRVPVYEVRRRRRPGALSAVTAASWLLATGLAAVAHHYGAY
jgi:hypothetical protein